MPASITCEWPKRLADRHEAVRAARGHAAGAPAAAIIAVAVFGMAHVYQGLAGAVGALVLGAVLAALYVSTGSPLLPIVVHVLVDLRGLVLVPPGDDRSS